MRWLRCPIVLFLVLPGLAPGFTHAQSGNQPPTLLSDLVDVSPDFNDFTNAYYVADSLLGDRRTAFNGLALLIVGSRGAAPGQIRIVAASEGLRSAEVSLTAAVR